MSIRSFLYLVLSILGLFSVTQVSAQGTTGNTITFDSENCTELNAGTVSTWFSYLRHNQAPIQILNANPTSSGASNGIIAPLNGKSGTTTPDGTGMFATGDNTIANNMVFSNTNPGELEFYNWKNNYAAQCFAIIAPKGYRITEYSMDICSNQHSNKAMANSGASGATIIRYTYNEGSTFQWSPVSGESMTLTGSDSEVFSHTLTNAKNILYFRIQYTDETTQWCVHMNSLRLTYVIDDPFEATVPNEDGENQVSTGILNLGTFKEGTGSNKGKWYFVKQNVTDHEDINIVATEGNPEMSITDGVISVAGDNTYYIESPAKYRIVGATLNFQLDPNFTEITYEATTTLESGGKYKISDGNGNYLRKSTSGNGVTNTTNESLATVWTITASGSGYTIYSEANSRFLILNSSFGLTTSTTASNYYIWEYDGNNRTFSYTNPSNNRNYGIKYESGWSAGRTDRWYDTSATTLTFYKQKINSQDYTATVYKADGNLVAGTAEISTTNQKKTITVEDMNNDAVKFSVSGGNAGFTVDLTLEPLDPTLQTLEIGYHSAVQDADVNMVQLSASNFNFGDDIVIPIQTPDKDNLNQIVFRNAKNEKEGTNTFLVDSQYELDGFAHQEYNKIDADMAGTKEIDFSNIKDLTSGRATSYKEYPFNKTQAEYQEIKMRSTDAKKTVYIYSGDRPLYCIMTDAGKNQNSHDTYTFYQATIKTEETTEVPVITLKTLFSGTYKGENSKVAGYNSAMGTNVSVPKDSKKDEAHVFYGVKVGSKIESGSGTASGYLTNNAIIKAIEDEMKNAEGVYADDYLRTILYVDMSELKSVAASQASGQYSWEHLMKGTADNCLFFMPSTMDYVANNVVKGGEGGRATGDIILYDQQPFYSPYNFSTGTRTADYTRNVVPVEGHEGVTMVTLVLPFTINLDEQGHLKTASDKVDESVTFYKLSEVKGKNETNSKIYDVGLAAVTTGKADAGVPYIVKAENGASDGKVFEISSTGIQYVKTEGQTLEGTDGPFTSHGTFNGEVVTGDNIFYFSKDYFWNSKTLTSKKVNIRPFRAWYTSENSEINAMSKFGLVVDIDDDVTNEEATGISEITTVKTGMVYDIQGRLVSRNGLSQLPKGLYIMDGKKIWVK